MLVAELLSGIIPPTAPSPSRRQQTQLHQFFAVLAVTIKEATDQRGRLVDRAEQRRVIEKHACMAWPGRVVEQVALKLALAACPSVRAGCRRASRGSRFTSARLASTISRLQRSPHWQELVTDLSFEADAALVLVVKTVFIELVFPLLRVLRAPLPPLGSCAVVRARAATRRRVRYQVARAWRQHRRGC